MINHTCHDVVATNECLFKHLNHQPPQRRDPHHHRHTHELLSSSAPGRARRAGRSAGCCAGRAAGGAASRAEGAGRDHHAALHVGGGVARGCACCGGFVRVEGRCAAEGVLVGDSGEEGMCMKGDLR
jgi:hypothetical protein